MNIEERFKAKVAKPDSNGCMNWMGAVYRYGKFMTGSRLDGSRKAVNAHRMAYELAHGKITDGRCVLHRCDNPICVNPEHLFLGTQADNMHDMIAKGRARKCKINGSRHHLSLLTLSQAKEVKAQLNAGHAGASLAREYGVSETVVYGIKHDKTYRDIDEGQ